MRRSDPTSLNLGPDVIQLLIPHRAPFLMVDRITRWQDGEQPSLSASRMISANEPVFAGHFPDLHLWPGVYTIEGLGQCCHLLSVLSALDRHRSTSGHPDINTRQWLQNLESGLRLLPGHTPVSRQDLLRVLGPMGQRVGLAAAVDIKLLHPVFAGERLDFSVSRIVVVGDKSRFEVSARVEDREVARGTLTGVALELTESVSPV